MIVIKKGDLFQGDHYAIVNTVNCFGVMGAGIAKQFKILYPEYFNDYKDKCGRNYIKTGKCDLYSTAKGCLVTNPVYIISFPTKDHWAKPSTYKYIEDGIVSLNDLMRAYDLNDIGIPALGCNNGGLDWNIVRVMMEEDLDDSDRIITIYEPLDRK